MDDYINIPEMMYLFVLFVINGDLDLEKSSPSFQYSKCIRVKFLKYPERNTAARVLVMIRISILYIYIFSNGDLDIWPITQIYKLILKANQVSFKSAKENGCQNDDKEISLMEGLMTSILLVNLPLIEGTHPDRNLYPGKQNKNIPLKLFVQICPPTQLTLFL